MNKFTTTLTTLLLTVMSLLAWYPSLVLAEPPPVLITEVQTGFTDANGIESPKQEYIELTNISSAAVSMAGWKLEYLSAANDGSGAATLTIDTLNSQIAANGHGIWEHEGYYPIAPDSIFGAGDTSSSGFLAKSGGHVRLMNGTNMVDCVSWGSAVAIIGCDKVASSAPAGYTLQRRLVNGTYDKSTGVANLTPATPQGNNIYSLSVTAPVVMPPTNPVQTTPAPDCDNVQLSEILANPAGDDAQGEFIELYNPTDHSQTLYGCSLVLSNGKQYAFTSLDAIDSHGYKAFPYTATGLQLSNSGATVTLVTSVQQTATTYPAVGDDEAWALVMGTWYSTKEPTPNAANTLYQPNSQDAAVVATSLIDELEPCPTGKYRSPETNRCRNIVEAASATVCPVGQERNPTTGRCRKTAVTATQVPCEINQTRNPDTGRCRKNEATAVQKPCDPGQERNADTGRCRKVTAAGAGKVLGATTATPKSYHCILVGVILLAVVAYAVYEYRHDLISHIKRITKRQPTV